MRPTAKLHPLGRRAGAGPFDASWSELIGSIEAKADRAR
jgi:hypothetical protein